MRNFFRIVASGPEIGRGISFFDEVERFEVTLIERGLTLALGKQKQAAILLGLRVTTLNSKIKRYQIDMKRFRKSIATSKTRQP